MSGLWKAVIASPAKSRDDLAYMVAPGHKVLVVINPRAKRGQGSRWVDLCAEVKGPDTEILVSHRPEDLANWLTHHRDEVPDTLAMVGGDGTLSHALTTCHQLLGARLPHMALLRGGTMNTIANGLGVPRQAPHKLLQRLVNRDRMQPSGPRRALLLVGDRAGLLFGTGVIAGFLDAYYEQPTPGVKAAAGLLASGVLSAMRGGKSIERILNPVTANLHVDGEQLPEATYQTIAVGTVAQMGLGFRPFHRAKECDSAFHMIAFKGSVRQLATQLPNFGMGRQLPQELGTDRLVQSLRIDAGDDELLYALDGELLRAPSPLLVATGPQVHFWP